MKPLFFAPQLKACFVVAVLGAAVVAFAQQAAPQAQPATTQLRIKTMPKPGKALNVPTPDFNNANRNVAPAPINRKAREWAVIDVTYETRTANKSGWTDNVSATFYVMAEGVSPETKAREFSFYTLNVRYVNVPDGEHRAGVVLPPGALERFGMVVAVACEITADGMAQPVVESAFTTSVLNDNKDDWWKNPRIVDSPIVKKRDGQLIERSKSPFGMINIDDYEAVR